MKFSDIENVIDKHIDEIIAFRRDLHEHPELGGNEVRTSAKVTEQLKKLPVKIRENVGGHGVIADLTGSEEGKTILLRGDMDALPINEINNLSFSSKVPDTMHACGHDMHTSIVLGTAIVLSELKDKIKGNVKFMFQPNEESAPIGGSRAMMADGLLENPKVDEAFALHVFGNPTGTVAFRPGVTNSRSDRITIEIKGKSSHGSLPGEGRDAIVTAANIISSIQTIISRNMGPGENAVVTIGKITGGSRYNVVSDHVILEGTVRTFDTGTADLIKKRLNKIVTDISEAYECTGILDYQDGYDFMFNDLALSEEVIKSLNPLLGKDNIIIQPNPLPAGEDFSFVTKKVPSVFLWLGTETDFNKGKCILHNPEFMADENSIKIGIKVLCKLVLDRLNSLE